MAAPLAMDHAAAGLAEDELAAEARRAICALRAEGDDAAWLLLWTLYRCLESLRADRTEALSRFRELERNLDALRRGDRLDPGWAAPAAGGGEEVHVTVHSMDGEILAEDWVPLQFTAAELYAIVAARTHKAAYEFCLILGNRKLRPLDSLSEIVNLQLTQNLQVTLINRDTPHWLEIAYAWTNTPEFYDLYQLVDELSRRAFAPGDDPDEDDPGEDWSEQPGFHDIVVLINESITAASMLPGMRGAGLSRGEFAKELVRRLLPVLREAAAAPDADPGSVLEKLKQFFFR
mmetsp:Transcript_37798/g.85243  ORF Transcript_37798/g.85243 Transcript_37798/m.85243 type:complete len:290 (-) Transcript_37798:26-895(-)|eukprot:CAMPEP_0197934072 /NCGR_PEP_ID=MMETSP1439-20131203/111156_1 /TAXON_ID=66791 /ORGANISM="Gonyaulax spinifera, Strain CCMP409" /LENGTH=289 /DNA_ID=CAMNT_0043556947 /DNA_START=72 /DNA_END=941 /DNA_ORIENTATION=+